MMAIKRRIFGSFYNVKTVKKYYSNVISNVMLHKIHDKEQGFCMRVRTEY